MKQIKLIFLLSITIFAQHCLNAMTIGTIAEQITSGSAILRGRLNYANTEQNYVAGGVTFSYATDWFAAAPAIQISLEQIIPHPPTETYVAEISSNSATSTTVMVYKISAGVVTEANTDDVMICLFALDTTQLAS